VEGEVLHLGGLLGGAVHRGHRKHEQRDEVEPVLRHDRHRRAEREQRAGGPAAEEEVGAEVVGDRGLLEERLAHARERGVEREEDDRGERDGGKVARRQVRAVAEAGVAREIQREAGRHPRDGELGDVEDDAVDGAPADQVGRERGGHLDDHHLGDPVGEQQREGERCGEGLLPHLAVHLDGEELADEDERGENPELGVERAEVAGAEDRQPDEYGDAGGADEPEVESEGGLRARHRGESRLRRAPRAWADPVAAQSERPKIKAGRCYSLRGAPSASSSTSNPARATAER
jgi:hypothetical protein